MNTFDIIGLDPLELNGKPATIQTIIDALWSDDYHEQQPMTGAPEVCLCELCQSLVPALEQVERENGRLRELSTAVTEYRDLWLNRSEANYAERMGAHDEMLRLLATAEGEGGER